MEVLSCEGTRTEEGWLSFEVDERPKVWFDAALLEGSGLCGRALRPKVVNGDGNDTPKNEGDEKEKKKSGAANVDGFRSGLVVTGLGVVGAFALFML